MIDPPDRTLSKPSRASLIAFGFFLLIDAAAAMALGLILYDAVATGEGVDGGFAICGALLIVIVAFVAAAVTVLRRRRIALAIVLAALPAVPSSLIGAAIAIFVMTFHHQP